MCDPSSVCFPNTCTEKPCVGVVCSGASSTCGGDGGTCVDTRTDSANCGACGSGEKCAASTCFPHDCGITTCVPLAVCDHGVCVDAKSVGVNCGAGKACAFSSSVWRMAHVWPQET
ncbi:MAG: hypothetical protein U0228_06890 [Myxococcaceae bacterium]